MDGTLTIDDIKAAIIATPPDDFGTDIVVRPQDLVAVHDSAIRHGVLDVAAGLERRFPSLFSHNAE